MKTAWPLKNNTPAIARTQNLHAPCAIPVTTARHARLTQGHSGRFAYT